ncbi:MAG TPA: hypothetical protein VL172_06145, partial [Kofleriaceae bacterium]|nr:hypothetical protein [Kofleriaceae bacterium]
MRSRTWWVLVLAAACSSSSGGDGKPVGPQPPPVVTPDAAPPPDPAVVRQDACRGGDRDACDAIAEFWAEREILRPERAAQGKADAEALAAGCDQHKQAAACLGL